jgi:hypothetical protein
VAALLACLPQLGVYACEMRRGAFPGSAYEPRVQAFLDVSRAAAEGGPFATVRTSEGFTTAPVVLSDLGMAAIMDAVGRLRGPVTRSGLALVGLAFLSLALFVLVASVPEPFRLALAPIALLVPLSIREYRTPDVVALHGAFAVLSVAAGVAVARPGSLARGVPLGVLIFVLHKMRSVYGLYALAAVVVSCALALRVGDRRPAARLSLALAAFAVLSVPWTLATRARAAHPQVVDGATLTSHGIYEPLISGVGWSSNRWGIKPWDPWVATFIGERLGKRVARVGTPRGEREARRVYWSLWREAPVHLAGLYLRRIPDGLRDYVAGGWAGTLVYAALLLAAVRRVWKGRDPVAASVLFSPLLVSACLVAQIVLIDTRLLYAYPLRFVSALGMALAAAMAASPRAPTPSPSRADPTRTASPESPTRPPERAGGPPPPSLPPAASRP